MSVKRLYNLCKDEAARITHQKTDILREAFGSLRHYMDFLEQVTFVNREWDREGPIAAKLAEIAACGFDICHNLGSGKITEGEIERLRRAFNVNRIFNIDLLEHEVIDLSADLTELNFEDDSVQLTYSSSVLEHVNNPMKAVAENYRILKPGGYAYFWVPFLWRDHGQDLWRFTKDGLGLLMQTAGFGEVNVYTTQAGLGECLRALSAQSLIPDFNTADPDAATNFRRLLFFILHHYCEEVPSYRQEEFYSGVCAICRK